MNYVRYCFRLIYDDSVKVDEMFDKVRIALERLFHFYEKSFLGSSDGNLGGQLSIDTVSSWDPDSHEEGDKDELDLVMDFDSEKAYELFLYEEKQVSAGYLSELDQYLKAEREEGRDLDLLVW